MSATRCERRSPMRSPSRWPTARRSPQRTPRSPGAPLESGHGPTSPPAAAPVAELRAAGVAATNEEAPPTLDAPESKQVESKQVENPDCRTRTPEPRKNTRAYASFLPDFGSPATYQNALRAARGGGQVGGPHAVATGGAVGIAAQLELAEGRRLRIEQQQPPDQRLSVADEDLEGLVGLQHSDDAWEHAQDPGLASRGGQFVRRRFGVHAAVAGAALLGPERAGVALEPED